MNTIFFYGLFMDEDFLREKGFHPTKGKIAYLDGYGLKIGERATLIYSPSERAYGVVMQLEDQEVKSLYSASSVSDYVPERIEVTEMSGKNYEAIAYNLPIEKLSGSNSDYAQSLSVVAQKVGLPQDYINQILSWVKTDK